MMKIRGKYVPHYANKKHWMHSMRVRCKCKGHGIESYKASQQKFHLLIISTLSKWSLQNNVTRKLNPEPCIGTRKIDKREPVFKSSKGHGKCFYFSNKTLVGHSCFLHPNTLST